MNSYKIYYIIHADNEDEAWNLADAVVFQAIKEESTISNTFAIEETD